MEIQKFSRDMNIIAKLDDEPNDMGGLSAAQLKSKFDEGGLALQKYINDILIPEVEKIPQRSIGVEDDGNGNVIIHGYKDVT